VSPQRIQLRRTKGWRKPTGAVVVSRPSRWGNPYRWQNVPATHEVDGETFAVSDVERRRWAVLFFRAQIEDGMGILPAPSMEEVRNELAGKDLACWCPLTQPDGRPMPCHADVLLELANRESGRPAVCPP
jgi:hypothetical protein